MSRRASNNWNLIDYLSEVSGILQDVHIINDFVQQPHSFTGIRAIWTSFQTAIHEPNYRLVFTTLSYSTHFFVYFEFRSSVSRSC